MPSHEDLDRNQSGHTGNRILFQFLTSAAACWAGFIPKAGQEGTAVHSATVQSAAYLPRCPTICRRPTNHVQVDSSSSKHSRLLYFLLLSSHSQNNEAAALKRKLTTETQITSLGKTGNIQNFLKKLCLQILRGLHMRLRPTKTKAT